MCQQSANKMPLDLNASAASLKSRGIKGSLYEARGSFYWRVCVTDSGGQRRTRKIPLRLRAQPSTLTLAETRIAELSALIQLKGFLPDQAWGKCLAFAASCFALGSLCLIFLTRGLTSKK